MSLLNQNSGKIHQIKSKPKFGFLRFVISAFFVVVVVSFCVGEGIESNRSFVQLKSFRSVFCLFYDFILRSVSKILLHVF